MREAEGDMNGELSSGRPWSRTIWMEPSLVAWLLLGLQNGTFVGKQDHFKDKWWQYQFFFITRRPWISSSHLGWGPHSHLSLSPWDQPWSSADKFSWFMSVQEKKCLLSLTGYVKWGFLLFVLSLRSECYFFSVYHTVSQWKVIDVISCSKGRNVVCCNSHTLLTKKCRQTLETQQPCIISRKICPAELHCLMRIQMPKCCDLHEAEASQ